MILSGLCAGLAQLAVTRAYAVEHAARVSGLNYLAVVVSALLGAAFLGERPGPQAIAGMALVVAGGLVVVLGATARAAFRSWSKL
jgi:drug/metabolite transporter (DMT)-like permease